MEKIEAAPVGVTVARTAPGVWRMVVRYADGHACNGSPRGDREQAERDAEQYRREHMGV